MGFLTPPMTGSVRLANNFTTSNTTSTATNLTIPIAANQLLDIIITGTISKASDTNGMKLAINAPSGATIKGYELLGVALAATAMQGAIISAVNTLGRTGATGTAVEVPFQIQVAVTNGSTPGNVTLMAATVTANVATVYAGTKMTWTNSTSL